MNTIFFSVDPVSELLLNSSSVTWYKWSYWHYPVGAQVDGAYHGHGRFNICSDVNTFLGELQNLFSSGGKLIKPEYDQE